MKAFLKKIVIGILHFSAKRVVLKTNPFIIAITGNVGKTSTKNAIGDLCFDVKNSSVVISKKSYNSEIGIPLTILELPNGWNNPFIWLVNCIRALWLSIIGKRIKTLIIEVGADRPNLMSKITSFIKPDILCMTILPNKPVHSSIFGGLSEIREEKALLIDAMKSNGVFIYSNDDPNKDFWIKRAKGKKSISVSVKEKNGDVYVGSAKSHIADDRSSGLTFSIFENNKELEGELPGIIGEHSISPILYAVTVGKLLKLDTEEIVGDVRVKYMPPPSRMSVLYGKKGSVIVDDSYNSSPAALKEALNVVSKFKNKKRIAVVGTMGELGKYEEDAHRSISKDIIESVNEAIFIGKETKWTIEELKRNKADFKYKYCNGTDEAAKTLRSSIGSNTLILVKASQSVRAEKVVVKLLENEKDKILVARQGKKWL